MSARPSFVWLWRLSCLLVLATPVMADVRVSIEGVRGAVLKNIEAHLAISELVARSAAGSRVSAAEVRRRHQRAPVDITNALQALGYYQSQIDSTLKRVEKDWIANYRIERGPPTRLRTVRIEVDGAEFTNIPAPEPAAEIYLVEGKRLHHGRYERTKEVLLESMRSEGFLDATVVQATLDVFPELAAADVHWQITRGPRYEFGDIRLVQTALNEAFARRYIQIQPGTPFNGAQLNNLQIRLINSGYFNEVAVGIEKDAAVDGRVPVTVTATPRASQNYKLGLGFGTDTGPRVTSGIELRRLNQAGHRLRLDLQASRIRTQGGLEYAIPVRDVHTDLLKFYTRAERADIGDANSDQYTFGGRLEDGWLGLRRAMYLEYSHEVFNFGDGPNRASDVLTPGIRLSVQKGDDLLFTRRGFSGSVDVHGGVKSLLSDTSFVHASANATAVWPLTRSSRLILRGAIGVIQADDFDALPPTQRFFTGGDRSVRGYAFESLSPRNAAGDDIGGAHYFNQSVEVDKLILRDFGIAAFYDRGGASETAFGGQHESVGIGFRYRSPVGMIRVDVAKPLDGTSGVRLHLGLGPDL